MSAKEQHDIATKKEPGQVPQEARDAVEAFIRMTLELIDETEDLYCALHLESSLGRWDSIDGIASIFDL
ncbi:MAG: hypothetical protein U9P14_12480, partial [Gemmatimonadota bacterium]|nr:hypothetical protein [Gemmatimonadota bacterium]